jgi:hypothetical protein
MKNLDVELYLNQFKAFFEKNPNELTQLIGGENSDIFYEKVKEQCYKNVESGDEVSLTQQQLIDIIVRLKDNDLPHEETTRLKELFQRTKFGYFCLN